MWNNRLAVYPFIKLGNPWKSVCQKQIQSTSSLTKNWLIFILLVFTSNLNTTNVLYCLKVLCVTSDLVMDVP